MSDPSNTSGNPSRTSALGGTIMSGTATSATSGGPSIAPTLSARQLASIKPQAFQAELAWPSNWLLNKANSNWEEWNHHMKQIADQRKIHDYHEDLWRTNQ